MKNQMNCKLCYDTIRCINCWKIKNYRYCIKCSAWKIIENKEVDEIDYRTGAIIGIPVGYCEKRGINTKANYGCRG